MIRAGSSITPIKTAAIPDGALDYTANVETWWSTHVYNPSSSNCLAAITPPSNTLDVDGTYSGNLQSAIDALPSTGGTLQLGNTTYGRVTITGKSNVYFLGVRGGTTKIRGVVIYGNASYATATAYQDWEEDIWAGNAAAISAANNRPRAYYFRDITFDGQGDTLNAANPQNGAVHVIGVRDILFDRCTFQNYAYENDIATPAHINASGMVDGLWCRWCSFIGNMKHAIYLDGVQGGGAVACSFAATLADRRIIIFNNNDYTYNYGGSGTMQPNEIREPRYIVIAGNTFMIVNAPSTLLEYHGADGLITKNVVSGAATIPTFLKIKTHCYNPDADAYLTGGQYQSYRNVMSDNTLVNVTDAFSIDQTSGEDQSGVTSCTAGHYGQAGKYTVKNNVATSVTNWTAHSGMIDTPNTVSGNSP